jgi:hypothetical protein
MGANAVTPCNLLKFRELIVPALVSNAVSVPEQTVKGGELLANWLLATSKGKSKGKGRSFAAAQDFGRRLPLRRDHLEGDITPARRLKLSKNCSPRSVIAASGCLLRDGCLCTNEADGQSHNSNSKVFMSSIKFKEF